MNYYFLETIKHLRETEEIILLDKFSTISDIENQKVINFLADEYEKERWTYPSVSPSFEPLPALWGAKTLYFACLYLLRRSQTTEQMSEMLSAFDATPSAIAVSEISAGAMLSADLCLRFLPQVTAQAHLIDPDDTLLKILEKHLRTWHYSAIQYRFNTLQTDFVFEQEAIFQDKCFFQLYVNRIMERKDTTLAQMPFFNAHIKGSLGMYQAILGKF